MMSEDEFWKIIDGARASVNPGDCPNGDAFLDREMDHIRAALRKLGPEGIEEFELRFIDLRNRAYRWDIWGAAYWEGGGCGNDGFTDFRASLVSLGRGMYESVLKDPDNLADMLDRPDVPTLQGEGFAYIATEAYKDFTGDDMNLKDFPTQASAPVGERWDFDDPDEVERRLPRLFAKLPDGGG